MDNAVIVSLISFAGTLIGSFGGMKLMSYRIGQLEKSVDNLNGVIDRVYNLERKVAIHDERIAEIERRRAT